VALFNIGDVQQQIDVSWKELEISGKYRVRDIWEKKTIGKFDRSFGISVNPHGSKLYKISKK